MNCVNGRIELTRERFGTKAQGSEHTCDRLVDETEAAASVGARQLCVREGTNARSFDRGRENLRHAAQIEIGEEQFRQIVEGDGKNVPQRGSARLLSPQRTRWRSGGKNAR
jgi:hypothetical protein